MAEKPVKGATPTGATGATGPAGPEPLYNFGVIEATLLDNLRPDWNVPLNTLLQSFRLLMYNAHQRKLTLENFEDVVNHTCDVHIIGVKLESSIRLQQWLHKRGQKTPNLDKAITALSQQLKAQKIWGQAHVNLVRQCAPPGTPVQ